MQISKKHHFVAQSILKRFRGRDGNLWHYSAAKGQKVEHRNTESIFQLKHDNTFRASTSSHDLLEQAFSKLDDDWKRHTDNMIAAVEANELPTFSNESRRNLFEILHKQQYRSPDVMHDRDQTSVIMHAKKKTEEKLGPVPDALLNDEDAMSEILHNAKVLARSGSVDLKVLDGYEAFEVDFLKTSCLVEPFVIGSAI